MANYSNISNASNAAVVDKLRQIKNSGELSRGSFIASSNPFRVVQAQHNQCTEQNIAEYIAASCLTHLYDGWNYLSTAMRAFVRNDVGVCGHAGYYAELRAALSLLSVNGVVICRREGLYLKSDLTIETLYAGDPTHVAVWEALKAYAQLPATTSDKVQVDSTIKVEGVSIEDWIVQLSGVGCSRTTFNSLLLECGADLERYSKDKDGRNKYSYSPTALEQYRIFSGEYIRGKIKTFWELFEPLATGNLDKFDMYILQSVFCKHRDKMGWSISEYESNVKSVINRLGLGHNVDLIFEKLCRERYELPFRLDEDGGADGACLHVGMLIRACFMLRLATAACRDLLLSAGVSSQDLDVWLMHCQKDRFMWQAPVPNYRYEDLWVDVDDSLTSLNTYAPRDNETWLETEARSLEILSRTEYIMLWGLGL